MALISPITVAGIKTAASDLNDGAVNTADFYILKSNRGSHSRPKADANQDGIVNSADLGIMMSGWGP